jgi:hypothetical protein
VSIHHVLADITLLPALGTLVLFPLGSEAFLPPGKLLTLDLCYLLPFSPVQTSAGTGVR